MRITDIVREAATPKRVRKGPYSLDSTWTAELTNLDLERALQQLFSDAAQDLGGDTEESRHPFNKLQPKDDWEDIRNPAFQDLAADRMSDAKVPDPLLRKALQWLKRGARGHIS